MTRDNETKPQWRNMIRHDLAGVFVISQAVHAGLPERLEVFEERLELFPDGCLVLESDADQIVGYAVAHPIRPFDPPVLNTLIGLIAPDATQFYIHDVALDAKARGGGFARPAIEHFLRLAAAYDSAALISVYGTSGFWQQFGFRRAEGDLGDKLTPYGPGAAFMTRQSLR